MIISDCFNIISKKSCKEVESSLSYGLNTVFPDIFLEPKNYAKIVFRGAKKDLELKVMYRVSKESDRSVISFFDEAGGEVLRVETICKNTNADTTSVNVCVYINSLLANIGSQRARTFIDNFKYFVSSQLK